MCSQKPFDKSTYNALMIPHITMLMSAMSFIFRQRPLFRMLAVLGILLVQPSRGTAQTVRYVTLSATNMSQPNPPANLAVQTNQIVSLVGYSWNFTPEIWGYLPNGLQVTLTPFTLENSSFTVYASSQIPQIVTGLTNIALAGAVAGVNVAWATFQITTPATANVVSNYVPADAIVIPASATGNVQIILETSPDLMNWTAANPGTYSASSATNRFFRVRAVAN